MNNRNSNNSRGPIGPGRGMIPDLRVEADTPQPNDVRLPALPSHRSMVANCKMTPNGYDKFVAPRAPGPGPNGIYTVHTQRNKHNGKWFLLSSFFFFKIDNHYFCRIFSLF